MSSNTNYSEHLLKNLSEMEDLRDLTLVAGIDGEKFLVHRNVMLASSAYFNTFLASSNDMETDHVEITLSKMTGATLKTIIDYCYSGHADITGDNIDQVMTAALDMKLIHLEQMCKLFWNENEDIENSVHKLMFASKFNLNDLWNNLLFFICHKFDEIPIAAMVQLDHDNFDAILKEDEIAAAESDIFECFVRWVQHDEINRLQFVVTIAPSIRLELLSKEFLSDVVEPFFAKYDCIQLVLDEYSRRSHCFEPTSTHRMKNIYLAEITDPGKIDIYKFDVMGLEFEYFGTASFDAAKKSVFSEGKFYVFGGVYETGIDVESYDLITSNGGMLPYMPLNSISSPPITIGNYIYAFEEKKAESGVLVKCARFANERKRWQIFHPLAFRMEQLSTVQLDGLMYIAGIVDHSENDSSNFWCYDPNRNIWIEKAHIDLDGDKIHLCKAKHSIFVCNHQVGCLKYDEIADRWSQINFDVFGDADVTSFHLLDVIDCGNESYGILSTNRGHLFVDIVLSENHCSLSNFMEYYLDDIDSISTRLHLFIH